MAAGRWYSVGFRGRAAVLFGGLGLWMTGCSPISGLLQEVFVAEWWLDRPELYGFLGELEGVRKNQRGFRVDAVLTTNFAARVAFTPRGDLLYVAKDSGQLRAVYAGGAELAVPLVDENVNFFFHRGMVGLAVDPQFAQNGYVYLFFTTTGFGADNDTQADPEGQYTLARYTLDRETLFVEPGSRTLLWQAPLGGDNHPGGAIAFLLDGTVVFSMGDAQIYLLESQDPASPYGKIHRINKDGSIPADNPFGPGLSTYALGLRDAFGLAVDPRTGALFASENGTTGHDELNRIVPGGNYGWPHVEGIADEPDEIAWQNAHPQHIAPLVEYGPISPSLTGMVFNHGDRLGARYDGALLIAQWNFGAVNAVFFNADQTRVERIELMVNGFGAVFGLSDVALHPLDGAMWVVDNPVYIYRIAPQE